MGGAASQDSYHHGRALRLVIHAEKLRTKARGRPWISGAAAAAELECSA